MRIQVDSSDDSSLDFSDESSSPSRLPPPSYFTPDDLFSLASTPRSSPKKSPFSKDASYCRLLRAMTHLQMTLSPSPQLNPHHNHHPDQHLNQDQSNHVYDTGTREWSVLDSTLAAEKSAFEKNLENALIEQTRKIKHDADRLKQLQEKERAEVAKRLEERRQAQVALLTKAKNDEKQRKENEEKRIRELKEKEERERAARLEAEMKAKQEAARLKELEEKSRKEKEEALERERQRIAEEAEQEREMAQVNVEKNFGSTKAAEEANTYIQKVKHVKETIDKEMRANKATMQEALRYRMLFTTKVGAVTNSKAHILQFSSEIGDALNRGKAISANVYIWLLNNLAKQIVKQCENEIAVNFKKAFPLANLSLLLMLQHPDLKEYILGRLLKKCPYLIPKYPRREAGESDASVRLKMGYKKNDDETESQFQERMNGMVAFFATLCQTSLQPFHTDNTIFTMSMAWTWLARFLNLPPRRVSADIVCSFLKMAGHEFVRIYGGQAIKLLKYIKEVYVPKIHGSGTDGGKVRLELMLDAYQKQGVIPKHEGHEVRR